MRSFIDVEDYRIRKGMFGTQTGQKFGAFLIPFESRELKVIVAPEGGDWEHVSVSLEKRCPNWKEMCKVKSLFWDDEDTVIQFHPPKSDYVNNHPFCLHMWKYCKGEIPRPHALLVGIKGLELDAEESK